MRGCLLFFLLFYFLFAGHAEATAPKFEDLIKKIDDHGYPVYYYQGKPYTGRTQDRHETEQTILEYHLDNGYIQLLEGWKFNGARERHFEYRKSVLHGKVIMYYNNGQKYFEENYIHGQQQGKQYGWYPDGSLRQEYQVLGGFRFLRVDYPRPAGLKHVKEPKWEKC